MPAKILFVDDDPNILAGFQRQLRKTYAVETALGGEQGLEAIAANGPFWVIVSDLRMPGMDGIEFLHRVRQTSPDSVRIMLTGYAELQAAIDAVNEGHIFRFLTKPCDPATLGNALLSGVRQYQLICAERELLDKTLRGSMKVLIGILELTNPEAFGRAARITRLVKKIARTMEVDDLWQIETAAYLSQIGCVILPEEALKKLYSGQALTGEEAQLFAMHPSIGSDLLCNIPRMETVAGIIANQERSFDARDPVLDEHVLLGSRILKAVLDFDMLQAHDIREGEALEIMLSRAGRYDPSVLAALQTVLGVEAGYEKMALSSGELEDGMILDGDLFLMDGRLLAARGYRVNRTLRERIKNFISKPGIIGPVQVFVPSGMAKRST
ncbi:MAG TPA: HD domain-containing phosphohydrolase [Syntrophobacteraceae bacterium]|nr:HD domain-containing phosphohydrolase [Syntrophobacteraceae bacterium]